MNQPLADNDNDNVDLATNAFTHRDDRGGDIVCGSGYEYKPTPPPGTVPHSAYMNSGCLVQPRGGYCCPSCSICLRALVRGRSVTLACGHNYHDKCHTEAQGHDSSTACPLCRQTEDDAMVSMWGHESGFDSQDDQVNDGADSDGVYESDGSSHPGTSEEQSDDESEELDNVEYDPASAKLLNGSSMDVLMQGYRETEFDIFGIENPDFDNVDYNMSPDYYIQGEPYKRMSDRSLVPMILEQPISDETGEPVEAWVFYSFVDLDDDNVTEIYSAKVDDDGAFKISVNELHPQ
jgi:hypothetical protein